MIICMTTCWMCKLQQHPSLYWDELSAVDDGHTPVTCCAAEAKANSLTEQLHNL